jgi:acetoin:2,6-dichlorophenolindophenol oxidoreductase subunit beta
MNMHKKTQFRKSQYYPQINNFADGIAAAYFDSMAEDPNILAFGLGATDPRNIFGTMVGLREEFGNKRVFDTPISENALTGMAVGLAISGYKPVLTHQRLDFSLLSMDQIVNSAAKWNFMFGGQQSVPLVIRMIIGQGWGQGPTHSQALQSWFAQIPGLKVIMPAFPEDAYNLFRSSMSDPNPVIFLEHRWLHQMKWDGFGKNNKTKPLGKSNKITSGNDVTIVSHSVGSVYALHAAHILKNFNINIEVIDCFNLRNLDIAAISKSIKKTGRLLTIDFSHQFGSIGNEIIAQILSPNFSDLAIAPRRMALPDFPVATSTNVEKNFYFSTSDICKEVGSMMDIEISNLENEITKYQSSSTKNFEGPF